MKLIAIYLIFITFGLQSISLEAVRSDFRTAAKDNAKVSQFNNALKHINENDMVELIAYKGAGITLKSRLSKKIKDKRAFFIKGVNLIELAIDKEPDNIELRFIRLGIQENTPKLLKYKTNITEDKSFILANYNAIRSESLKKHIKFFVQQSDVFNTEEKLLIH
jgi:hypothetical protein